MQLSSTLRYRTARTRPGRRYGLLSLLDLMRQRRDLAELDPHQLRDIGLEQEAADREARRAMWDVPDHWLR